MVFGLKRRESPEAANAGKPSSKTKSLMSESDKTLDSSQSNSLDGPMSTSRHKSTTKKTKSKMKSKDKDKDKDKDKERKTESAAKPTPATTDKPVTKKKFGGSTLEDLMFAPPSIRKLKPTESEAPKAMPRRKSLGSGLNKTGDYGISDDMEGVGSKSEHYSSSAKSRVRRTSSGSNIKDIVAKAREAKKAGSKESADSAALPPAFAQAYGAKKKTAASDTLGSTSSHKRATTSVGRSKSAHEPLLVSGSPSNKRGPTRTKGSDRVSRHKSFEATPEEGTSAVSKDDDKTRKRRSKNGDGSMMGNSLSSDFSGDDSSDDVFASYGLGGSKSQGTSRSTFQDSKKSLREQKLEERLQLEEERNDQLSKNLATLEKQIADLRYDNDEVNRKRRQEQRDTERTIAEKNKEIKELSDTVDRILEAERKVEGAGKSSTEIRLRDEMKQLNAKVETLEKCLSDKQQENAKLEMELKCYKDSSKSPAMRTVESSLQKQIVDMQEKMKFKDETIEHLMEQLKVIKQTAPNQSLGGSIHRRRSDMDRSGHGGVMSSISDTINKFSPGTLSRRRNEVRAERARNMVGAPSL